MDENVYAVTKKLYVANCTEKGVDISLFDNLLEFSKYSFLERLKVIVAYSDVKMLYDRGSIHRFMLKRIFDNNDVRTIHENNLLYSLHRILVGYPSLEYRQRVLDFLFMKASISTCCTDQLLILDVYHFLLSRKFDSDVTGNGFKPSEIIFHLESIFAIIDKNKNDIIAVMASHLYCAHLSCSSVVLYDASFDIEVVPVVGIDLSVKHDSSSARLCTGVVLTTKLVNHHKSLLSSSQLYSSYVNSVEKCVVHHLTFLADSTYDKILKHLRVSFPDIEKHTYDIALHTLVAGGLVVKSGSRYSVS